MWPFPSLCRFKSFTRLIRLHRLRDPEYGALVPLLSRRPETASTISNQTYCTLRYNNKTTKKQTCVWKGLWLLRWNLGQPVSEVLTLVRQQRGRGSVQYVFEQKNKVSDICHWRDGIFVQLVSIGNCSWGWLSAVRVTMIGILRRLRISLTRYAQQDWTAVQSRSWALEKFFLSGWSEQEQ